MSDSPRIGYVTSLFARPSDTFIRNEINQLRRLGVSVTPFSIRRPELTDGADDDVRRFQSETVYVLEQGVGKIFLRGLLQALRHPARFARAAWLAWRTAAPGVRGLVLQAAYLAEALSLSWHIRKRKIEMLHNHIGENSATVAMLAAEFSQIPFSLTIHGPYIFFAPERWALGTKVARSAFTVCISDFCRSQCSIFAPESAWPKLQVIRCSVQPEFVETPPQRPMPETPHFLCVGRLCTEKGQAVLVDAAARVVQAGCRLQVSLVGDGPGRGALERRIREAGVGGCVKVLGWQSSAQIEDLLLGSTALVIPSFAEGLPVVAMESLAMARPVIATNIGAISELVENGESGWIVPAGSVDGLSNALRQAIECPTSRLQAMGAAGRQRVLELHHPVRQAEQLWALFDRALAANRKGGMQSDNSR